MFNNKIIEFNGDYWHCNPNIFPSDYFNSVKQKTANEIWDYDKRKKECAEEYNNKVLVRHKTSECTENTRKDSNWGSIYLVLLLLTQNLSFVQC